MRKKDPAKLLIGIICVLSLILAVGVAVILDGHSPDPILGIFQTDPTDSNEETQGTIEGINIPTDGTTVPTAGTNMPDAGTKDPTNGTENPTGGTEESTSGTEAPTEGTSAPTEGTKAPPEDPTEGAQDPTGGTEEPTAGTEEPTAGTDTPTEETKAPGDEDTVGITFPYQVSEYKLVIEKVAPYNGVYVEDGSNVNVNNVAMLLVQNKGDFSIEYAQICLVYGQEKLQFNVSALPAGEKLVVQEKDGKSIPSAKASDITATVAQRADMEMSGSKVKVTDNGNNTLTIQNLTNKTIPTVRVFYKYYMEKEGIYVGGIAFTVRVTRLGAGASVTVQPSHYTSQTSRVVMVMTYDSEV